MKCEICRGACCEVFELAPFEVRMPDRDSRCWLEYHAISIDPLIFDCKCQMLTVDGRCAIYPNRPSVCSEYPVGGLHCLSIVKKRRSLKEYQMIRDDKDPLCL
jgi:Fe-S-cluster containining protein